MAIHYYVTTESAPLSLAWNMAKRADAAKRFLLDQVYESIKANAGLDTQWGHNAMAKARAMEIRAPKRGESITWKVQVKHHVIKVHALRV